MKFHCIADEDTVRGFRLAGIEGVAVDTAAEAEQAVRRAAGNPDIGILILTDLVAAEIRPLVDDIRVNRSRPLITEIPGPDGPMPGRKTLRQLVQEAVGIRLEQEENT